MSLEGHTVSLQLNGVTYSAQTDAAGVATFSNIVPDVYNISTSWDITSSEYNRITGSSQVNDGATVSVASMHNLSTVHNPCFSQRHSL